jgi:hypothetical protein
MRRNGWSLAVVALPHNEVMKFLYKNRLPKLSYGW